MNGTYVVKKAMVVDDNHLDRLLATTIMKKNTFAQEVVCFSSVDSALSHLQKIVKLPEDFPSVIFLDVNMPVKDGFAFLDGYITLPEALQRGCTIVMISATNSDEDFERIGTYPVVQRFFPKPLTKDILRTIGALIHTNNN